MGDLVPLARSPIALAPPVEVSFGWEVSARRSAAPLRLADRTPLAKVLVRARPDGRVAARLGVRHGWVRRDGATLIIGSGPGEWLLVGAPGSAADLARGVERDDDGLVSVLDFTYGRALLRLTGAEASSALSKVCPIDLSERNVGNLTAFRSSVAKLATEVVREDVAGTRSYLLHCERSSGRYLYDALLDAGREFAIEPDGFTYPEH